MKSDADASCVEVDCSNSTQSNLRDCTVTESKQEANEMMIAGVICGR